MLRFKGGIDRQLWNAGDGPEHVRQWIAMFNAISWHVAERACVVTSWGRTDGTFHQNLLAVDFRRMSQANAADPKPYTKEECAAIEAAAVFQGLPLVVVGKGEKWEHWHCGPIHLKDPANIQ